MLPPGKIKFWTILAHGFILVGGGHGVFFFVFIEIIWFPYFTKDNFCVLFTQCEQHFPFIGLLSLCGQICLIVSIWYTQKNGKVFFQWLGLVLLWLSVIYFIVDLTKDTYLHLAFISLVPFVVCTLLITGWRWYIRLVNHVRMKM